MRSNNFLMLIYSPFSVDIRSVGCWTMFDEGKPFVTLEQEFRQRLRTLVTPSNEDTTYIDGQFSNLMASIPYPRRGGRVSRKGLTNLLPSRQPGVRCPDRRQRPSVPGHPLLGPIRGFSLVWFFSETLPEFSGNSFRPLCRALQAVALGRLDVCGFLHPVC